MKSMPLLLFLAALVLRLMPVLATRNMGIGLDDMFQYDMLARSIVAGNGYRWYAQADLQQIQPYLHLDLNSSNYDPRGVPTSFRPPLYPTFLALIYLVSGTGVRRFFVARLVQTVLGAALAPLTYWVGWRLFKEQSRASAIGGWIVAVYPILVVYPLALATENLFFFLVLASTLALLKAADSLKADVEAGRTRPELSNRPGKGHGFQRVKWFFVTGLLLGLTALTRSVSLGMAGLAVVWIWFWLRERKLAVVTALVVAAVTIPWMVRNSLLDRHLTGIESALGYDLYVGYYPTGSGTFQYPQSLDLLSIVNDGQRDLTGRLKALEFIRAEPERFLSLIGQRAGYFFGLEDRGLIYFYSNNFFGYIQPQFLVAGGAIFLVPFMIVSNLGALGLALAKWKREAWLVALLCVGYIMPHLFIIAEDRFHLTLVPFLAVLAGVCLTGGWAAMKIRWQTWVGRAAICLAVLAMALLLTNWGMELSRNSAKLAQLLGQLGNQTYFPY